MLSLPNALLRRLTTFLGVLLVLHAPALATWSIVVLNHKTGEVCVATATCIPNFQIRRYVPVVRVGLGGAAAQSWVDSQAYNRGLIWDALEEGAEPEFPGPGVQAEVRPGRVRSGEQCARQCRGRGERDDRADGRSSAEAQGDQDERRPQDVELLLDGERPVVLDRGGGQLSGEVVGTPTGEHQVHGEARGREDVDTEFVESGWLEPDDRREAGGGEYRR